MDLLQDDVHEWFGRVGSGAWTVVSDSWHRAQENGGVYCALAPRARRERALARTGWDLTKSDCAPGFSIHYEDDSRVVEYLRGTDPESFEPIVILRDFHGVVSNYAELVQEFRLYHNLYWDSLNNQFLKIGDSGEPLVAARLSDSSVKVRTDLLRQYQAARQLDLYFYIDSVRFGSKDEAPPDPLTIKTEESFIERFSSDTSWSRDRPFTRYLGKRVLPPPPVERSGIWPYDEETEEEYPSFIIGFDEFGAEIRYSCNHDALANNFGANPDAPHYLTPVYFRRDVLKKYYDQHERYSVSDGHLTCAALWAIRIDNSADDAVVVFLGDLGRDLPASERDYWRSYNIPPLTGPSETLVRRAFLGQWAEPVADDLRLRSSYREMVDAWMSRHGWDLFRRAEGADAGLLERLHLPLNDTQGEFENAIRILTLLLVDAINDAAIVTEIGPGPNDEKGIAKLERFMRAGGYPEIDRDVKFLRDLQDVRSRVTAHHKGKGAEKVMNRIFGAARGVAAARVLFRSALTMTAEIRDWAGAGDGQ